MRSISYNLRLLSLATAPMALANPPSVIANDAEWKAATAQNDSTLQLHELSLTFSEQDE